MKAMILERPAQVETSPLRPADLPDPEPGPGQVRIRVRACGICRTDLHQVEGEIPMHKSPVIPGHQVVGLVDRIGPGEGQHLRAGDRVGLPWLHSTCGHCPECAAGLENLCPQAAFTGYDVDGGYAQHVLAPAAFCLPLPAGLTDHEAAPLLCGGIIGYRALRVSGIRAGEALGLYGFGSSAHICIQIARFWNCRVYVFSRTPEHQRLARELGAAWTGNARGDPPELLDRAIIFAPAGWLVPEALRVLRPGGTVALAGIYMDEIPPLDYQRHLYMERALRSVTAATRRDGQDLLALAQRIPLATTIERFPLSGANEALQRLKRGGLTGAGVLEIP